MQRHGFKTRHVTTRDWWWPADMESYLSATRGDPWWFMPIVGWEWRAWLTLRNDMVFEVDGQFNISAP